MIQDSLMQFREAMQTAGIRPPAEIKIDGLLHRFCADDKHRDLSAWYVFYADGIPAGSFGDWRLGIKQNWHAPQMQSLNGSEALEHQKRVYQLHQIHEAVDQERALEAANYAQKLWAQAGVASSYHPYLLKKGVQAHGIREYQGKLVIPVQQGDQLQSLQWIEANGTKRFLKGAKVKGGFFTLGTPNGVVCLCEGYATGASLFEATGHAVVIAFHAGNLKPVATLLGQQFHEAKLIICADDDRSTPGNPGLTQAKEAAELVAGVFTVPHFGSDCRQKMSDFNDLHQSSGIEAVQKVIERAIQRAQDQLVCDPSKRPIRTYLECLADTTLACVTWLWPEWLAAGMFHLLAGAPATGKTTLALHIAAIISSGAQWPDGTYCEPGNVLIWSTEDERGQILAPCLFAHAAAKNRIYFIKPDIESADQNKESQCFDPARDLPKLYKEASEIGNIRLIIIDPIVDALDCDSYKNAEVRRALQPLMRLGRQLGSAILGISHFSKGVVGDLKHSPLEWVTGSVAFGALALFVWLTAKSIEPDGTIKRLLIKAKSNTGAEGGVRGYYYDIEQASIVQHLGIVTSRVIFREPIVGQAESLLTEAMNQGFANERSMLEEAMEFLKELLSHGPVAKKEIEAQAKEAGFKEITVRRAKKALGVQAIHEGYGKDSIWKWSLLSKSLKASKEAPARERSSFQREHEPLCDLEHYHPATVEGCKRSDILAHAIPEDYEMLKKPEVFALFACHLRDTGQIKVCETNTAVLENTRTLLDEPIKEENL
jgi:putative DNA primase/helicase